MNHTTRRSFLRGIAAAVALGVARTPLARALGATTTPLVEREPVPIEKPVERDVVLWGGPGHGKRISGVYAARLELPVHLDLLRGPEFITYVPLRDAEGQPLVVALPISAWSPQATEPAPLIVYARSATLPDNTTTDDVIADLEQAAAVLRYAFH